MPNIVLGVSGSVAAYRAADLARELIRQGFTVRVCLTDAAERFVTRDLFEALTGNPCLQDVFHEPEQGRMAHIDWARSAEILVIAPATANTLNRLAQGLGEDMLTTLALAYEGPILIAPAMNPSMYQHDTVQDSLRNLQEKGAIIVEPTEGDVACGENGQGKLAAIQTIAEEVVTLARRSRKLAGKHVLITAGPTQEALDDVRYLTNRSSGKMGIALARAAMLMGAEVSLVHGPTHEPLPRGIQLYPIQSATEMLAESVLGKVASADLIIGAAAVADYHPKERISGKHRREETNWFLELVPNPDVIATYAQHKKAGAMVIGFAAEPTNGLETAQQKMRRKGLQAIVANDISRKDIGFDAQQNEMTLLWEDGRTVQCEKMSKLRCAIWLFEQITEAF